MIGKTLAHYEITAAIGKGGMGEVYQATDKKLGRSVAIKVLPEEFAQDTERVARFEREAKLLASLNHPNIAAIYGLEQSEGTRFLVLELVEGQTLSERLVRGPVPVQESLELALQIAEALEAAHEKGVIHRDLKPANIKVTSEGKVKVLDFGLAKAYAGAAMGDETVLETLAEDAESGRGVLLGTPAYMSPEQARRQPADHRSDVWAFGCVLYELLTGRMLFKGNTLSDIIAAVLEREPDLDNLPRNVSPGIRRLLGRCLAKNPKRRLHSIADVRLEIDDILSSPEGTPAQATPQGRHLLPYAATLALAILVGAVGTWYLRPLPQSEPLPVTRFHYELPEEQNLGPELGHPVLTVSPTGNQIVYVADSQLYLWDLTRDQVRLLPTDDDPSDPLFSPDGRWVAYFARNRSQLKKIGVDGSAPFTVYDVGQFYAMAGWADNDTLVFGNEQGIMRVSAEGGAPELLVQREGSELLGAPQILSGGKSVLFTTAMGREGFSPATTIMVQSLETDERKLLIESGLDGRYVPTGHLVYGLGEQLLAVPFDTDSLELTGNPVVVQDGVLQGSSVQLGFGANGTLAYLPGGDTRFVATLKWLDRSGEVTTLIEGERQYGWAALSPDAQRIAALVFEGEVGSIWIYDVESGTPSRLPSDPRADGPFTWTPDGERLTRVLDGDIYWQPIDGSEPPELLWDHSAAVGAIQWSSDGRFLTFCASCPGLESDVWLLSMADRQATPFLGTDAGEGLAKFSPDGQWMSFLRTDEQSKSLMVVPFANPRVAYEVAALGSGSGGWHAWSRNGRNLYYRGTGPDFRKVMSASVVVEPTFRRGEEEILFELPFAFTLRDFDANSERFLILDPVEGATPTRRINVVQNWFEELKEKVPVP